MNGKMTSARLQAFGDAWAGGDVDALMEFLTDDCVFGASVGPDPGATFNGRDEVRAGIEQMLGHDDVLERGGEPPVVLGDRGFTEWSFVYVDDTGARVNVRGCDLFEFEGDRIRRKDAFRKTFPVAS